MYLLDTNIVSEMRKIKQGKADPKVANWAKQIDNDKFFINTIILMELRRGALLKLRKDKVQGEHLLYWVENIIKVNFAGRILPITEQVSNICSECHVPNPRPENDTWIASTAIAHNFTLVTRNVDDFYGLPVKLLNPFE